MEIDKIKKRKSYEMFQNILEAFNQSKADGLKAVHSAIDQRHGYGSQTSSQYAKESLDLLIKEQDTPKVFVSPKKMVCRHCNSETVLRDAWASWDEDIQDWVLETVFDAAHCGDCDGETSIMEVELEATAV